MADYQEEDLFDDLYDEEPASKPTPAAAAPPKAEPEVKAEPQNALPQEAPQDAAPSWQEPAAGGVDTNMDGSAFNNGGNQSYDNDQNNNDDYGPINVKEDGKMFIGGLNWETTEDSLKNYFTQFGEVSECTVMRDSATGRSRGFGFLTFRDPKCVNTVMVKEHYLDGKIIDPKRAIPREEQERTSKIFVGGVSQEATEEDFTNFFKQFGRVVDATLMMDKETGRPRGFGFVTFDGDAAVDATLKQPLQILGKPIEVKRAQPRGNMRDGEDDKKFGRNNKFGNRDGGNGNGGYDNQNNQQQQGGNAGMTPAMMAQYWQRMQQYFQQMQQQLAAGGGMPGGMGGMGGMNPMQMQQMQQMQNMQNMMGGGMNRGTGSPNPMQMQQMQQMQQQQMMQQGGGFNGGNEQAFEQQKYEQQQARRQQQSGGYGGQGGPTSWEGMYDDAPQPSIPSGPGGGRGGFKHQNNNRQRQGSSQPPTGPSAAPINAPTGPKNAGKPGANYRGGGRTNNFRHQPYGGGRG